MADKQQIYNQTINELDRCRQALVNIEIACDRSRIGLQPNRGIDPRQALESLIDAIQTAIRPTRQ
jgi:hypothetical protein